MTRVGEIGENFHMAKISAYTVFYSIQHQKQTEKVPHSGHTSLCHSMPRCSHGSLPTHKRDEAGTTFTFAMVSHSKSRQTAAGIQHKNYNGHSFCIGAATATTSKGIEDSLMKTLRQ